MNTHSSPIVTPGKRHWFLRYCFPRFSTRTLLVLATILGIAFAVAGNKYHRVVRQRQIVAELTAAGREVNYSYEFGFGDELDPADEREPVSNSFVIDVNDEDDAPPKRKRLDDAGDEYIEVETPPGPLFLRQWLGNDFFAHVEMVDTSWSTDESKTIKEYDPHILLELPELKVVVLTGEQVNDEWLQIVAQIPKLTILQLWGDNKGTATREGLAKLQAAKHLQVLTLSGAWLTDDKLDAIATLRTLKCLTFFEVPHVQAGVFRNLRDLTNLQILDIYKAPQVANEGAENLARLQKLRKIMCRETGISDATLVHMARLAQLEMLILSGENVGDHGVKALANLPNLECLDLARTQITDAGLKSLADLPKLKALYLGNTKITNAGMPVLAKMKTLKRLSISACTEINDEGILRLRALQEIDDLSIGPHVSDAAVQELRKGWKKPWNLHNIDKEGHSIWSAGE